MNYMSVGDMVQTYQFRRHNVALNQTLTSLTEEVSTGLQSDIGAAVKGDHRTLDAINTSLSRLASFAQVRNQASIYATTMQSALSNIQSSASDVASSLVSAASTTGSSGQPTAFASARSALDTLVSSLNTSVAGRYVFSGTAVTTAPMASSDTILASLSQAVSGLTSFDDISAAVDDWFDAAQGDGGYLDVAYQGNTDTVSGLQIAEGKTVSLSATGADQSLKDTMKGLALASLAAEGAIPDDSALQAAIASRAGALLMSADSGLTEKQSLLGTTQARIEDAETSDEAQKTALSLARTDLIGADDYDTATALTAVQDQIETLYTLTSKLSALSLVNYL